MHLIDAEAGVIPFSNKNYHWTASSRPWTARACRAHVRGTRRDTVTYSTSLTRSSSLRSSMDNSMSSTTCAARVPPLPWCRRRPAAGCSPTSSTATFRGQWGKSPRWRRPWPCRGRKTRWEIPLPIACFGLVPHHQNNFAKQLPSVWGQLPGFINLMGLSANSKYLLGLRRVVSVNVPLQRYWLGGTPEHGS